MISLSAFILSVTKFDDMVNVMGTISKTDLENRNILFMDDGGPNYLANLFGRAQVNPPAI